MLLNIIIEALLLKYKLLFLGLIGMVLAISGCVVINNVSPTPVPTQNPVSVTPSVTVSTLTGTAVRIGDNVSVDYTGSYDNGTVFDTSSAVDAQQAGIYEASKQYSPMSFVVGSGSVIKGFDDAVIGMRVGETKTITLAPDQAYGAYNTSLIMPIPLKTLTDFGITPHAGDTLYYNLQQVRVVNISNDKVYIDFNHPMAGKTLHFKITLRNI